MATSPSTEQQPLTPRPPEHEFVFEYRILRLLLGVVAFLLPVAVVIFAQTPLESISASYHTSARDIFVGTLFVIATFLVAYQGYTPIENWIANLGALAAIVAALCPTSSVPCETTPIATIHLIAGATLFLVIAYFCFGPFRQSAKGKEGPEAKRRARLYSYCGSVIILSILFIGIAPFAFADCVGNGWGVTYVGEFFAMWAFGFAWIVASKMLPWLADKDELRTSPLKVDIPKVLKLWKK